jgi:hypothetical protein
MSVRTKRIILGAATVLALVAGWFLFREVARPTPPPPAFTSGRSEAAALASRIVSLTDEVHRIVGLVNIAERAGEHDKTRALIEEAEKKNDEAHGAAVALAEKLRVVAELLGALSSPAQQRLALEAVSRQLALAGEYLSYTETFAHFIEILKGTVGSSVSPEPLTKALEEVNASASRINEANRAALEKNEELDRAL